MKKEGTPPSLGQIATVIASFASNLPCGILTAEQAQAFIGAGNLDVLKAFLANMFRKKLWLRFDHVFQMHARVMHDHVSVIAGYRSGSDCPAVAHLLQEYIFTNSSNNSGEIVFFTAEEFGMANWSFKDVYGDRGRKHLDHLKLEYCEPLDVIKIIERVNLEPEKLPGGQYAIYPLYLCRMDAKMSIKYTRTQISLGQTLQVQRISSFDNIHRFSLIAVRRITG